MPNLSFPSRTKPQQVLVRLALSLMLWCSCCHRPGTPGAAVVVVVVSAAGFGFARGRRTSTEEDQQQKQQQQQHEASVDATTGRVQMEEDEADSRFYFNLVNQLIQDSGADAFVLSESVARDIAAVLQAAKNDPETSLLLLRLQSEKGQPHLQALQDDLTPDSIVSGLAQTVAEMEMAELLFDNPERAVVEMEKEGMIPAHRVAEYKKNPQLLAEDTRKRLYFTLVSLAVAGGYL